MTHSLTFHCFWLISRGSQASIPELIRKQSERQKQRPESAKHARLTRPFSAKRPRPQSAKEPATTSPAVLQVYDLNELEPAAKPPMAGRSHPWGIVY